VPYGLKDGPQAAVSDKKAIERANQQELRSNVSKLYEIVADLKDQVDLSLFLAVLLLSDRPDP